LYHAQWVLELLRPRTGSVADRVKKPYITLLDLPVLKSSM